MSDPINNGTTDLPDPKAFGDFGKFVPPLSAATRPSTSSEHIKSEAKAHVDVEAEVEVETKADAEVEAEAARPVEALDEDLASIIFQARKSPEEVAALVSSKKEFVAVPVVKTPPKGKYFRVREGEEWDFKKNAFLMLPADFGSDRREYLFVHPKLEEFVQSKRQLRLVMKTLGLAFVVDMQGTPAFWALNLGDSGNWGTSARLIAEELKNDWGMVCSDKSAYVLERPEDDLGEPVWPEGNVNHWLAKAFADHLIDSEDHPEIKKLLGRTT